MIRQQAEILPHGEKAGIWMFLLKKRTFCIFRCTFLLILVAAGLMLIQPGQAAAAKAPATTIGIVDYGQLMDAYPGLQAVDQTLRTEAEQAKQEFASRSAGLNDQDKQRLGQELGLRLEQKRQQLLQEMTEKINVIVGSVAAEKKLTIVVFKDTVITGGVDITKDVAAKFTPKK